MEIVIRGETAQHIAVLVKRDPKLARALAQQYVETTDPVALQRMLLNGATAVELLAARLAADPQTTLSELSKLPRGKGLRSKAGGRTRRSSTEGATGASERVGKSRRRRKRLSEDQVQAMASAVVRLLQKQSVATRGEIVKAAAISTQGHYNRVMSALIESKTITAQGDRAKRVYQLASGAPSTSRGRSRGNSQATSKARG